MVITEEFKFPPVLPVPPYRPDRQLAALIPVGQVGPVARLRYLRRELRKRERVRPGKSIPASLQVEKALHMMIEQLNQDMETQGIQIYLVLVSGAAGYSIDVYDCTDKMLCRLVREVYIGVEELPNMIRNLQEK
ncbi:MAG: hypothetical protein KAI90_03170, partial [Desulfobulbaceae bacterium]|nr:hypothetical protein [Desulfobulbaceae bacterium]